MKKIREIMRLNEQSKLSQRQISQALGMSRPVVSDYINKIKTLGLTFIDIENMPDETLTYSGSNLPPVPEHACHLFWRKVATYSG